LGSGSEDIAVTMSDKVNYSSGSDTPCGRFCFLGRRPELEEKGEIRTSSEAHYIPFKDSNDILLLNGTIDQIDALMRTTTDRAKDDIRSHILKEAYDALRANGVLVITVENRLAPAHLYQDSAKSFTVNSIAKTLVQFLNTFWKNKAHDSWGYWNCNQLLKKIGFTVAATYGCYPDYYRPSYVYSLDDSRAVKFIINKIIPKRNHLESILFKTMSRSSYLRHLLSPSFVVFGLKENVDADKYFVGDLVLSGHKFTKYAKIFDLGKQTITKVLRNRTFHNFFQAELRARTSSNSKSPLVISADESRGFMVETIMPGLSLKDIYEQDPSQASDLLPRVFSDLLRFYHSDGFSYLTVNQYSAQLIRRLRKHFETDFLRPYLTVYARSIEQSMEKEWTKESKIPIVQVHGDFCLQNILYSDATDNLYFIDWEWTRKASIFFDFFHLISIHAMCTGNFANIKNMLNLSPTDIFEGRVLAILGKYMSWATSSSECMKTLMSIFLGEEVAFCLDFFSDCNEDLLEEVGGRWYEFRNEIFGEHGIPRVDPPRERY